jgi:hypothetical protein
VACALSPKRNLGELVRSPDSNHDPEWLCFCWFRWTVVTFAFEIYLWFQTSRIFINDKCLMRLELHEIRGNEIELRPQFSCAAGRRRIFQQYQFQSRSLHLFRASNVLYKQFFLKWPSGIIDCPWVITHNYVEFSIVVLIRRYWAPKAWFSDQLSTIKVVNVYCSTTPRDARVWNRGQQSQLRMNKQEQFSQKRSNGERTVETG